MTSLPDVQTCNQGCLDAEMIPSGAPDFYCGGERRRHLLINYLSKIVMERWLPKTIKIFLL